MNDLPRRKLREIIERHGRSVLENPRRCEGLLRDHCGEYKREISVLIMALEEHAAADLLTAPAALPKSVLLNRLSKGLSDNLALSDEAADWSINSWAWALGVISETELQTYDRQATNETEINSAAVGKTGASGIAPISHNSAPAGTSPALRPQSRRTASGSGPVLIVSPSGGDFVSVGQALRAAAPGTRIVVREGVYDESLEIRHNVEIAGEGAVERIIIRSSTHSCISMRAESASVSGITLQGLGLKSGNSFFAVEVTRGSLQLNACDITSDSLSCIAIHGVDANPNIENCRMHDSADSGIYIFDNARAVIENCDVYRNTNVNIAITQGANPTIKKCRVFDGSSGGVVVWDNGATGTIEDCEIYGNRLANVGIRESANPIFRRCRITGSRDTGLLVQESGYGTFVECDIHSNAKAEVAITDGSNTTLRECNIHSGRESGVYVSDRSRAAIENSNIYDNREAGVLVDGESAASIRGCHIRRNGTVAVRLTRRSSVRVEDCDLRGNRVAVWGSDHGTTIERHNNRER